MEFKYFFGNLKKSLERCTIKCIDLIKPKTQKNKFEKNVWQNLCVSREKYIQNKARSIFYFLTSKIYDQDLLDIIWFYQNPIFSFE